MGLFDSILGPDFLGLSGQSSNQTTTQTLDPTTQALNTLRFQQVGNAGGSNGGLGGLLGNLSAWGATDVPQQQLGQASQYAQQPGLDLGNWYNQSLMGLNDTGQSNYLSNFYGNANNQIQNQLGSQLLGAGGQYFQDIMGPQINSQYGLMGLGRSGANEQAQAMGASSIALPIATQLSNLLNQSNLQQGQQQYGLGQQQLQNLYSLNTSLPSTDVSLRGAQLSRLGQGVNFADYARQVGSGVAQNSLQGYLSALNATPYTPAGTTNQSGSGNQGVLNTSFGAGVGQGVGKAIAA